MVRRQAVKLLHRIGQSALRGTELGNTQELTHRLPSRTIFHHSALARPGKITNGSQFQQSRSASAAVPARQADVHIQETRVDAFGAVSVVTEQEKSDQEIYRNVDGQRFEDGRYAAFMAEISCFIPESRQYTDPVRTFAYGTDASFYRLNPKLVVKVHTEDEIRRILPIAHKHQVPVTFRAAGTSLSGQAITDSVLLKISHTGTNFRNYTVHVSLSLPQF